MVLTVVWDFFLFQFWWMNVGKIECDAHKLKTKTNLLKDLLIILAGLSQ